MMAKTLVEAGRLLVFLAAGVVLGTLLLLLGAY